MEVVSIEDLYGTQDKQDIFMVETKGLGDQLGLKKKSEEEEDEIIAIFSSDGSVHGEAMTSAGRTSRIILRHF